MSDDTEGAVGRLFTFSRTGPHGQPRVTRVFEAPAPRGAAGAEEVLVVSLQQDLHLGDGVYAVRPRHEPPGELFLPDPALTARPGALDTRA